MEGDPVQRAGEGTDHSPLHLAATMAQNAVARALRKSETERECT
jgi:hypothetical protein